MFVEPLAHLKDGAPFLVAAIASILTWRFWSFTIRQALYPHEPKQLPYWIPFFGHAGSFLKDFNTVMRGGRLYFKNTREPFSVTIAGQTIYILTSAKDVATAWKHAAAISMDPISEEMYTRLGISPKSKKALFDHHPGASYNAGNARPLNPTDMIITLHQQQLHPGPRLDELMKTKVLPGISKSLDFGNPSHAADLSRTEAGYSISLLKLCIDIFIGGTTDAYFGSAIWAVQPELVNWFMRWEYTNWKYLFQLPALMSRDMLSAKQELVGTFTRYCQVPHDERGDRSFFVNELEKMLREVRLTDDEIGGVMMLHYWAIVGNVYKVAFWMIAYLVQEPALMAALRTEMLPAVHGDVIDEQYLDNCPTLESFFNEVLRLTVTAPMGRVITESIVIGGKFLQKGNKVMIPFRELHTDPEVFGPNPQDLDTTKFTKNPKLLKNASFRPWGGGITMCPGRFLAKRSIYAFLALLLSRYDVSVNKETGFGERFPKGDDTKPSPGVTPVSRGEDMVLKLRLLENS